MQHESGGMVTQLSQKFSKGLSFILFLLSAGETSSVCASTLKQLSTHSYPQRDWWQGRAAELEAVSKLVCLMTLGRGQSSHVATAITQDLMVEAD